MSGGCRYLHAPGAHARRRHPGGRLAPESLGSRETPVPSAQPRSGSTRPDAALARAAFLALLLVAAPAAAQRAPEGPRPLPAERAWIEACVLSAQAHPPRAAFGRCAWRIASACQGEPGEGLLVARLPPTLPGRPLPAQACAQVEAALWQQQMDRWLREVGLLAPAAQQEALRRAQRAFIVFRDAGCAAERVLSRPAEAAANELSCRLEATALRALDLKRLRDEMWLAIASASVEGP